MADVIVVLSTLLGLAFVAAWLAFPRLRVWIERPKYHFQERLEQYDLERSREAESRGDRSA